MKSIKLSVLLVALAGAGLTACNSGSSGTQAPKSNTVANTESATPQKEDASASNVVSVTALNGRGTIGVVVTRAGNLDYYENDKFMGVIHKFEDSPTGVQIAQVGIADSKPTIIYVSSGDTQIHKCIIPASGGKTECSEIYRLQRGLFSNSIAGIYFDAYGNGYASINKSNATTIKGGLIRFVNDRDVETWDGLGFYGPIDTGGSNHIFVTRDGVITDYDGFYDRNPQKYDTKTYIDMISVDKDLYGYAISERSLYRLNGRGSEVKQIHSFEDRAQGISSTGSAVYVGTGGDNTLSSSGKGELKKCDPSGNCSTIDTFGSQVKGVSFREF